MTWNMSCICCAVLTSTGAIQYITSLFMRLRRPILRILINDLTIFRMGSDSFCQAYLAGR